MASDLQSPSEQSLASLVGGILKDAQDLIKQEMALARREISDELNKTKEAAISFAVGLGFTALGGLLLIIMLVHLLHWAADPHLPLWGCYGIVGGVLLAVGGALFFLARSKASSISLVPKQTVETMKENVQWIKNQT